MECVGKGMSLRFLLTLLKYPINMSFQIHTLHRGRFILLLLGGLFLLGVISSSLPIAEVQKIVLLLLLLPVLLYLSVRFSQQPSEWRFDNATIVISKGGKEVGVSREDLLYFKNHIRSGGNLIALYRKTNSTPLRFWRNKLFQGVDDFDAMLDFVKSNEIPLVFG